MVLVAGSPRSRHQHGCILVRALFLVLSLHLLIVPYHNGRGRGALWDLFNKGTNLIHEVSASHEAPPLKDPTS